MPQFTQKVLLFLCGAVVVEPNDVASPPLDRILQDYLFYLLQDCLLVSLLAEFQVASEGEVPIVLTRLFDPYESAQLICLLPEDVSAVIIDLLNSGEEVSDEFIEILPLFGSQHHKEASLPTVAIDTKGRLVQLHGPIFVVLQIGLELIQFLHLKPNPQEQGHDLGIEPFEG
jgi:hypothetical protein